MPPRLLMSKHHGLGNDFLVVLASRQQRDARLPGPDAAVNLCDRHRGIGADGLIVARPPDADDEADLVMELYNADGSVAEISGNGIRCLCQAELDRRGVESGSLVIDTLGGRRNLDAWSAGEPDALMVRVDMGAMVEGGEVDPSFVPADAVHMGSGRVGNPHVVFDVGSPDAVAAADLSGFGAALDAATPGGINVHVAAVTAPSALVVRHWERGAGMTQACGSGATASAALMAEWGLVDTRVEVSMPGGLVTVDLGGAPESLHLEGPSVRIADIEVCGAHLARSTVPAPGEERDHRG